MDRPFQNVFMNNFQKHLPTVKILEESYFLQGGDPYQNSKKARDAMDSVEAKDFSIPPRSTDLNPLENIFHQVKHKLGDDALERNIVKENFHHF